MYDPRSLRIHALPRLLLVPLAMVGLTACGVAFSGTFDGTEMFKGISMEGDRVRGAELTVIVEIERVYPVPVEVSCYYEDDDTLTEDQQKLAFHDRAVFAGRTVVEPADQGVKPGDEVEPEFLSFTFKAPEVPGDYFIACLSPAAPDNGFGLSFDIE